MRMTIIPALLMTLTAACGGAAGVGRTQPATDAARSDGLAFAQRHCAACHAIDAGISPRPEAPSFEAVINTPGLTAETLRPWLRNSHNFPAIMNFEIAPDQIDALAAYMLTLRSPDYKPAAQ